MQSLSACRAPTPEPRGLNTYATLSFAINIHCLCANHCTALFEPRMPPHPPAPCPPLCLATTPGARPDTRARNRVVLYELSAQLEKAAAKRQRRQGEQPEQEQRPPSSTAQRRKGADAEAQQQAQQQADQQQAPAPAPASGKKGKKRRQQEEGGVAEAATPLQERQEQRQQQAAAAAPDSQASPAAAPALPPPSSSKKKAGKKSRLAPADVAAAAQAEDHEAVSAREQELLAAAVAAVTGGGASGFGTPIASASAKKKAVRFSLKRNLVNVIGQPPKPAEVRTPPTSKPKGSALKKESAFEGPASAPERLLTRAGGSFLGWPCGWAGW